MDANSHIMSFNYMYVKILPQNRHKSKWGISQVHKSHP